MDQSDVPALPANVNADEAVLRLMALAEGFRTRRIPKYKLAIKCLMAAQKVPCSKELAARAGLETGKLLWYYTKNVRLARLHLEHAYKKFKEIEDKSETAAARLQTICMIGEIYLEERGLQQIGSVPVANNGRYEPIKSILMNEIETAQNFPLFQAKILFILIEIYIKLKDFDKALEIVKQGAAYFQQKNEIVLVCYFGLIKCLIYSIQSGLCQMELGASVAELGELLNKVPAETPALEDIRAFCYSIQLSFFLAAGFFTNSKKCLQQLHLTVQLASKKENETKPHFRWLSSEMLTGVAYLLTVLTNIQFNNIDRAKRYFVTSVKHFEALRQNWYRANWPIIEHKYEQLTDQLEIIVYEAIAPTFLIIGHPEDCISHIQTMRELMTKNTHLIEDFGAQFHCLLGTYAAYFCENEAAKTHFTLASQMTSDQDLMVFSYLSLGLVYLYAGNRVDFYNTIDKITTGSFAKNTKALISLVNATNTYLQNRVEDCKKYIGQSLNISQEAEMGRIQALASLLLSTMVKGDDDALNVGITWAEKLGDISLRLWGCRQKCEQLKKLNDTQNLELKMAEANQLKQQLEANRQKAKTMPDHQLLKLTDLHADLH